MLRWRTLTYVPIDRRLIVVDLLTAAERNWVDDYHQQVLAKIGPALDVDLKTWFEHACAPLCCAL